MSEEHLIVGSLTEGADGSYDVPSTRRQGLDQRPADVLVGDERKRPHPALLPGVVPQVLRTALLMPVVTIAVLFESGVQLVLVVVLVRQRRVAFGRSERT